jgi:hypothetical protein
LIGQGLRVALPRTMIRTRVGWNCGPSPLTARAQTALPGALRLAPINRSLRRSFGVVASKKKSKKKCWRFQRKGIECKRVLHQ